MHAIRPSVEKLWLSALCGALVETQPVRVMLVISVVYAVRIFCGFEFDLIINHKRAKSFLQERDESTIVGRIMGSNSQLHTTTVVLTMLSRLNLEPAKFVPCLAVHRYISKTNQVPRAGISKRAASEAGEGGSYGNDHELEARRN